jgi:hypothetical protein
VFEAEREWVETNALEKGRARGLGGARLERQAADAVRRWQRRWHAEPYVTAAAVEDGTARFWARVQVGGEAWRVEGTLVRSTHGHVLVHQLSVRPWADHGAMPSHDLETSVDVLKRLRVAELRRLALDELRVNADHLDRFRDWHSASGGRIRIGLSDVEQAAIAAGAKMAGPPRPKPGRGGVSIDFYRGVARDAIRINADGQPVYDTLASERQTKPRTTRKWIATSRAIGTLDPQPRVWRPGPNFQEEEQ